jgi:two-component system, NarL family, sensor histidine kinase DegS
MAAASVEPERRARRSDDPEARDVPRYLSRFRARLRDGRFWRVQGLMLAITVVHTAIEATHGFEDQEALSFIPVSLYFIPVLYAGLNFGLEGALPTAFLGVLLAVPNALVYHGGAEAVGELFQVSVLGLVACLVARRVDREAQAKERAEQIGARLAQLNATATAVSRSLAPDQVARETLSVMLKPGRVDAAWITAGPSGAELPTVTLLPADPERPTGLAPAWEAVARRVVADGQPRVETVEQSSDAAPEPAGSAMVAAVPIEAAGDRIGTLGVVSQHRQLTTEDLTLLEGVAHQLAVALENIRHYQEEKRALAELTRAQESLVSYLRLATEAQEEERKRLARELHDETIQSLVVIKASLDSLTAQKRLSETVRTRLETMKLSVETAVDNVRRFCHDLRPSLLDDLGLVHAIDWLVADLVRRTSIQAHLDVEGAPRRLSPDVEVAVYRIVQEALRNVERHSGAENAVVTLAFRPGGLAARIVDDGGGLEPARTPDDRWAGTGLGLLGMQERARLVGGRLIVESLPEGGTKVSLELDGVPCLATD